MGDFFSSGSSKSEMSSYTPTFAPKTPEEAALESSLGNYYGANVPNLNNYYSGLNLANALGSDTSSERDLMQQARGYAAKTGSYNTGIQNQQDRISGMADNASNAFLNVAQNASNDYGGYQRQTNNLSNALTQNALSAKMEQQPYVNANSDITNRIAGNAAGIEGKYQPYVDVGNQITQAQALNAGQAQDELSALSRGELPQGYTDNMQAAYLPFLTQQQGNALSGGMRSGSINSSNFQDNLANINKNAQQTMAGMYNTNLGTAYNLAQGRNTGVQSALNSTAQNNASNAGLVGSAYNAANTGYGSALGGIAQGSNIVSGANSATNAGLNSALAGVGQSAGLTSNKLGALNTGIGSAFNTQNTAFGNQMTGFNNQVNNNTAAVNTLGAGLNAKTSAITNAVMPANSLLNSTTIPLQLLQNYQNMRLATKSEPVVTTTTEGPGLGASLLGGAIQGYTMGLGAKA